MDSSKKEEAVVKAEADSEVKVESSCFIIDSGIERKPELATICPLKVEIDNFQAIAAEPGPSSSRAVAEVRVNAPPPAPLKYEDPFDLAPRARYSPPPPPTGGQNPNPPKQPF